MYGILGTHSASHTVPFAGTVPVWKYSRTMPYTHWLTDDSSAQWPTDSCTTTADPPCSRDRANALASGVAWSVRVDRISSGAAGVLSLAILALPFLLLLGAGLPKGPLKAYGGANGHSAHASGILVHPSPMVVDWVVMRATVEAAQVRLRSPADAWESPQMMPVAASSAKL